MALLTAAAAAIDIGRLYYTQRDLQKLASLAAVSSAQIASGCSNAGIPGSMSSVQSMVQNVLTNNGGTLAMLTGVNGAAAVRLGKITPVDGVRTFEPLDEEDEHINAVQVNLTRPQPTPFLPFLSSGSGTLKASATAQQSVKGSLSVGSGVLELNAGLLNALLSALLGGNVSLTAVEYRGLASVDVSVDALATALNVDSRDLSSLLTTQTTLPLLLDGLSPVLDGTTLITTQQIQQLLSDLPPGNNSPVSLGDVLGGVVEGASSVLPVINLLDLITQLAAASQADPTGAVQPIALTPAVGIPGVVGLNTYLQILEPAKSSGVRPAGLAQASTAQVRLMVRLQVDALSNIVNGLGAILKLLGVNIGADPLKVAVDVQVAPASAFLDELACPRAGANDGNPVARLSAQTGVATVSLGTFLGNASAAPPMATSTAKMTGVRVGPVCVLLCLGTLALDVNVTAPVYADVGGSGRVNLDDVVSFDPMPANRPDGAPPTHYLAQGQPPDAAVPDNPQTLSSGGLLQSTLSTLVGSLNLQVVQAPGADPGILGALGVTVAALTNSLVSTIKAVLGPLLAGVGGVVDALVDPLLQALGIEVGKATVIMNGVYVDRPRLVTTCVPNAAPPPAGQGCPVVPL